MFVLDFDNNRIQKWASGAKYGVTVAGHKNCTSGTDSTSLDQVYGFNMDNHGNLFIADNGNARIQLWTPHAKFGETILKVNVSKYYDCDSNWINGPLSVFIADDGTLYEGDMACYSVYKWGKSGSLVNEVNTGLNNFKVYPNPANSNFILDLETNTNSRNAVVEISNILGEKIYTRQVYTNNGKIHATINDFDLAKGLYFVRVNIGEENYTSKVLIQR